MAFWKFTICLLLGLIGAVMVPFMLHSVGIAYGLVTYANSTEVALQEIIPILETAPDISSVSLPVGCQYALFDKQYEVLKTNLQEKDMQQAVAYLTEGIQNGNDRKRYQLVTRKEEYLVIQYYIGSQFTHPWFYEHFPTPEQLLFGLIGIFSILVCVGLTARFAKQLKQELQPLLQATKEVAKQNLDFQAGHSSIKEYEEMVKAFTRMQQELKLSLEQQWKEEQRQKEQIAAMAHDIKTPLTILQGNVDLLQETTLDSESKTYLEYILNSTQQIHQYVKMLIDISRLQAGYQPHKQIVKCQEYVSMLQQNIAALCQSARIHLQMRIGTLPEQITIDSVLVERAIMNIINNAITYAPVNSTLWCEIAEEGNYWKIVVRDEGTGFSKEALLHGKEQFFMEDGSRTGNMHYGMGLFIAETVAKEHGGKVMLENSKKTKGAKVSFWIMSKD